MEMFTYGFRVERQDGDIRSTISLSHPGAVSGSKGLAVRVRCVLLEFILVNKYVNNKDHLFKLMIN